MIGILSRLRDVARHPYFPFVIACGAALGWWCAALQIKQADIIPVWYDQQTTFTQTLYHLSDPYQIRNFANPPWTAILLAPFSLFPIELSVLVQLLFYFVGLTAVMVKYGGRWPNVLVVLSSFLAFLTSLELNVEWLVVVGLLVPKVYSGPFIAVKPQIGAGYFLSLSRNEFICVLVVLAIVAGISFLLWGNWLSPMLQESMRIRDRASYNVAPMVYLSPLVSIFLGFVLAWYAIRRHDPVFGLFAGLFFVPYVAAYSLLIPFALVTVRWFRVAVFASLVIWVVYGGVLLIALTR